MNPFSKQGAATGKKCNSAMSIDVFGEKSNRSYHETKVIECFRDFESIPLCLEMYDMLVRYFYHCIFNFQRCCYPLKI